jgi:hypothetical protein
MKNHNERSFNSSTEYVEKRRLSTLTKRVGLVALAGTLATSGALGAVSAFNSYNVVETKSTAQSGKAEIIEFDADYEAHCWTATKIQVTGSGTKDETMAVGVSLGWQTSMVDALYKQTLCVDSTKVNYEVNQATGEVGINIPNKDVISTQTDIILALKEGQGIRPYGDQTPGYVIGESLTKMSEALPIIEYFPNTIKNVDEQDKNASLRLNMGLILGAKAAKEQCQKETWALAAKPFENGVKRMVSVGLSVAQAMRPDANIDPTKVSVTVEGKPIDKLDAPGDKSNIDDAIKQIEEYASSNKNFTLLPPEMSGCEVSEEVKKLPTQSESKTKIVNQEYARHE